VIHLSIIDIKKLTKYYGKSKGIEDVSLSVEEGEIFGFIGPNGAGKSTTIRTLLALIYPTSGSAEIFGKDCIKFAPEIAKHIGYLPSEVFYYENMKAIDLLNYSASFYRKDCSKRIKELAEIMELDLSKKIDNLSYGNKKKVGIIQGLLHDPKLIILDEPTGGLDPLMQNKFFDLLKTENEKGTTILFSSHILSEVQRLCHRVAIIKDGSIINVESMASLRQNNYKKIRLELIVPAAQGIFNIEGVSDLTTQGTSVSFIYKGDINVVLRKVSDLGISDILIQEPDLEEIFLHYYEKES
jgi:ABC-2 type transport system ATP-binding protein